MSTAAKDPMSSGAGELGERSSRSMPKLQTQLEQQWSEQQSWWSAFAVSATPSQLVVFIVVFLIIISRNHADQRYGG